MTRETTLTTAAVEPDVTARKPRLALMGEFSAGKSTLTNMLLGGEALPVRVTATRLPPIWISHGPDSVVAVSHDGAERALSIEDLAHVSLEETKVIRMQMIADTLEICDLIDMPGISDPNMSSDVWLSLIDEVDSVVWCTHATQAWRQSEAAVWEGIVDATSGRNLMLVTQIDKLRKGRDRGRVMSRIAKETEGLFEAVYPISLTGAIKADEDVALWQESGAADFVEHLVELLLSVETGRDRPRQNSEEAGVDKVSAGAEIVPMARPGQADDASGSAQDEGAEDEGPRVMPKRVQAPADHPRRTERPTRRKAADRV